jgi:hypothetical protein
MTDELKETYWKKNTAAFEAKAKRVAEIKAQIVGLDREQLIDQLAETAYRAEYWRKSFRELRDDPNRCSPAILQEKGGPEVEVILRKVTEKDPTGETRIWFEPYYTAEAANARRARSIASKGGQGRAAKLDRLEAETIRLYTTGTWKSVPEAALAITPIIVEMSKDGKGDLFASTTKPLEWIRAYNKAQKKKK